MKANEIWGFKGWFWWLFGAVLCVSVAITPSSDFQKTFAILWAIYLGANVGIYLWRNHVENTPLPKLDYNKINPGIRKLVRRLRAARFATTDSGDGVTNVKAGMEGALAVPHVFMVVSTCDLAAEADRLRRLVRSWGVSCEEITASYNPEDKIGVLALMGVEDSDIKDDTYPGWDSPCP